jgi:hypothetical protein
VVVHAYNPCYIGSIEKKIEPYLKKWKDLEHGSSALVQSPEFKPQYHPKEKEQ